MATVVSADPDAFVANATYTGQNGLMSQVEGLLSGYLGSWSKLQIAVTILLILISYDQCMPPNTPARGSNVLTLPA